MSGSLQVLAERLFGAGVDLAQTLAGANDIFLKTQAVALEIGGWKARAEAAEAKVAALEARLAEVAPVVEVLLSMQANEFYVGQARLREAMSALRAARAKREEGKL